MLSMQNNTDTKSLETWVQHVKSLTPEGRRDFAIKMRDEQIKFSNRYIIFASISSIIFSSASFYLWGHAYHMSQESTFGIFIGLTLFFIGFQFMKSSLIYEPLKNFYPDDFTDDDIFTYFQELSKVEQKASVLARIGKIYFIVVTGVLYLPLFLHFSYSQYVFSASASASGMSM